MEQQFGTLGASRSPRKWLRINPLKPVSTSGHLAIHNRLPNLPDLFKGETAMDTHRNNLLRAMQLCSVLLLTFFIEASAQAQTPAIAGANSNRGHASRDVASRAEVRLSDLLVQARPPRRPGFSLMPSIRYTDSNVNGLHTTAGVDWARSPEVMRQMKETRAKQIEESKQRPQGNDR
jgi:hypothetical protein